METTFGTLLLSTKLKIPAPRKNYIVRGALFEQLSQCCDMSVIFVRGGAGTGKTTLLSTFIREKSLKNISWVSLDASNANVYSFWLYFTTAISSFWEDGDSLVAMIRSNPDASHMEELLIMLINRICGDEDYYLVLDDAHLIKDAALVRTFEFFIGAMPSNFHLFLLSREDPPVYLGPLAISGRLLFIDGKQMLLSAEEGITFLRNTLKLAGSDDELKQLNNYAEGWIGGLQLAAAAGAGTDSAKLLRAGGGIATEYLTREVFESLKKEERDFLIRTAFLSYFDLEMCCTLFSEFTGEDFERMIEALEQKNLFIICIDEHNGIYRYHNILSEYLNQQYIKLPEAEKNDMYLKAARMFEQRGDYEEALREFNAAGEFKEIMRVTKAMGGRIESWSYLDQIPMDLLITDADLTLQCFMYNFGNMNMERCRIIFEYFKENYGTTEAFHSLKFTEIYLSSLDGIVPQFHVITPDQINKIQLGPISKSMIYVQNSMALTELMRYEEAEQCILEAIKLCEGSNIFVVYYAYNQLAQIYEEMGRLNDSLNTYVKSSELFKAPSMLKAIGTNYYFGITGVYMRRMELKKADQMLEQAKLLMEKQHIHTDLVSITLDFHLAEMKFLYGDIEAGIMRVNDLLTVYSKYSVLTLARLVYEMDCENVLPKKLAEDFLIDLEKVGNYSYQPFMRLIKSRLLFKKGELSHAMSEVEDILVFSRLHNNKLRLVEAGLLKVVILMSKENTDGKRELNNLILEALHYAREDKILLPFYLDRSVILPLLYEISADVSTKNSMTAFELQFLKEVIDLCSTTSINIDQNDLLSVRELEVLRELSMGITNREIAEKLCISQATVKTHIISIFGKLKVSSRLMAVDKARKEGMIS